MTHVMERRETGFPVEMAGGVPVVIAPAEIDITNAAGLRTALLRAAAHGRPAFVVDMARTVFCDSAGLHVLLGAHRRAQAEGSEVRLVVTGAAVRRLLALTATDRLLNIYSSLDEALAASCAEPGGQPD
jgi:anti-sigma B factor antagonist